MYRIAANKNFYICLTIRVIVQENIVSLIIYVSYTFNYDLCLNYNLDFYIFVQILI